MKAWILACILVLLVALAEVRASTANISGAYNAAVQSRGDALESDVMVGGEPVVFLNRAQPRSQVEPQFLQATVLPGNGMNLLQLRAYIPGKGDVDLIGSPALSDAKRLLAYGNDEFGNQSFMVGGAILLPYPNRIRGALSNDGKTIETKIADRTVALPANWHGRNPGAKVVAMHGLILAAQFEDVHASGSADRIVRHRTAACRKLWRPLAFAKRRERADGSEGSAV